MQALWAWEISPADQIDISIENASCDEQSLDLVVLPGVEIENLLDTILPMLFMEKLATLVVHARN